MGIQIDLPPTETAKILAFLTQYYRFYRDLRIYSVPLEEDNRFTYLLFQQAVRIQYKCSHEQARQMMGDIYHRLSYAPEHALGEFFPCEHDNEIARVTECHFCMEGGCFAQVAATQVEAFKDGSCLMAESGGEDGWHEIHDWCPDHLHDTNPIILPTIQVKSIEPGKLWHRVVSWQNGPNFYAQYIWLYDEGDYESGENIIVNATRWLGPCETREQAIELAQKYDEDAPKA